MRIFCIICFALLILGIVIYGISIFNSNQYGALVAFFISALLFMHLINIIIMTSDQPKDIDWRRTRLYYEKPNEFENRKRKEKEY